jgi:uncharacterized damage-inducible protein DinB
MNHADLQTLLDYHYWARDRMLAAVETLTVEQYTKDLGNSFKSVRDTVVHIYFAEWIWYARWMGNSPLQGLNSEDFPDVAAIRRAWNEHEAKVRSLLEGLGDKGVDRVYEYKNLAGQNFESIFWHMFQHVVNHATYHRGQVTTMVRQLGANPGKPQDLIAFYREQTGTL